LKTFILPLEAVIRETPDAVTLRWSQPLVDRFNYLPGQYLTLKVDIEGETYYRSYSMSSTPGLDRYLAVTVKRVPGGTVSNYINDHFEAGRLVEFLKPAGHFTVDTSVQNQRHLVLIAGGSGITPLMSILRAVLFSEPRSRVSLLYANRSEEQVIFKQRLDELEERFGNRFHLRHLLSRPEPGTQLRHHVGRLEAEDLPAWLEHFPRDPAWPEHYYLCGPDGLMQVAQGALANMGVAADHIWRERFVATEEITQAQHLIQGPTRPVELVMGGDTYTVQVPPGLSILQAALAQGVKLPYSCRRGICSTCMSRLEQGQVEMDNPESLLDFEVQKGWVLTCQAHPTTDDVRVRIGT